MMSLSRRGVVAGLITAPAAAGAAGTAGKPDAALPALGSPTSFTYAALDAQARRMADQPYRAAQAAPGLEALDFDAMGEIRFRPDAALWKTLPGANTVEFFHLGRYARQAVEISVVQGAEARRVLYSPALFDIPKDNPANRLSPDLGFAGFRVMNADHQGDWIAYLGAAYFRSASPFNQYGLSARGLAVNTATAGPEEFPRFSAFWLEHDQAGDLVVNALLEGPSVVGAYRITHQMTPAGLAQEVSARLYIRAAVDRLGIAPLTSMYWYGASDRVRGADWRPQIHDSDGLAIWTGAGERIWRPLTNPPRVVTNTFVDHNPRGFGLMQRDRVFADYQDDGAFYDRRPSLWIEPLDPWGAGSVQLVEIPTDAETNDNIVAFWTPAAPVKTGDALTLRYRMNWCAHEPANVGVAQVTATRWGIGGRPGQASKTGVRKYVVDFEGGRLANLDRASGVTPVVTMGRGRPLVATAYPVVGAGRWRLMFDVSLEAGNAVDLRAFLGLGGESLTETWVAQAVAD
jgi:glucans biosynthesis protein